jgi:hypothetical protein
MDERAFAAGFPNEPLYWLHLALFAVQSLLGLMVLVFFALFVAAKIGVEVCKIMIWLRCPDPRMLCEFSEQTRIGPSELLVIAASLATSVPMLWPLIRILFWK